MKKFLVKSIKIKQTKTEKFLITEINLGKMYQKNEHFRMPICWRTLKGLKIHLDR